MSKANIIKVCGMRQEANIRAVEQLPIDWMGFIFYRESPRFVGECLPRFEGGESSCSVRGRLPRFAGEVLPYMPEKVKRVGVFVNEEPDRLLAIAEKYRLDIVQLHGEESPTDCSVLQAKGFLVMKSFGISASAPFPSEQVAHYEGCCDYFLFDTKTALHGGSGKKFEWERLSGYRGETPFLLSGGISPGDVEAIRAFSHPKCIGIDLNSGFEISPAVKNVQLLQPFLEQLQGDAK